MDSWKTLISTAAVVLTFVGYAPYIRDTLRGTTKPHAYSWFVWGLLTAIVFALQIAGGAGVGAWVTLAAASVCFVIVFLGVRGGQRDITRADTGFLALALVALFLWLIVKQPVASIILVSAAEMLGFAPTVRKSWNKPHTETLFTYQLNALRHGLSILALQQYTVVTWLYPVTWTVANAAFSMLLIVRRSRHRV